MTTYCVGIDTGGTYTDAVLLETDSRQIVTWNKTRTTHHDLSVGIGMTLEEIFRQGFKPEDINQISVSTSLATDAVVNGSGARVGLFVIGNVKYFKLPVVASIFLKGGHTITGEEDKPLDIEGLVDILSGLSKEVDSYAVCGAMSIKNPTHELVVREAISLIDPKPVFCSHQVSKHPGILERSATACLHAKLMPLMTHFTASIQQSINQMGLTCPVTIICGNGKGASLNQAIDQAATTMASGPAASARYGATVDQRSALVVDVGGTTIDVCLLRDGTPQLIKEGATIGEWQTHVEAVDIYTSWGGGDSQVVCNRNGQVILNKRRMQPLAMTPGLPDPGSWLKPDADDYLILPVKGLNSNLVVGDELLTFLDRHGPTPPSLLERELKIGSIAMDERLQRLSFLQRVKITGFTPTDALIALGRLSIGNCDCAKVGASILAGWMGITDDAFCKQVISETESVIETTILNYLGRRVWQGNQTTPFLNHRKNDLFYVQFALRLPIIGIGAAARCFLPGVAKRLQTNVIFPEHYEVGNAIGAALIGQDQL